MTLEIAARIWLSVQGLLIGSFLNVVIARVPRGQSVVSPRSRCPRCELPIAWYDNIPVLSWLILRGRCRGCGLPISIRYLAVEVLTAVLFALAASRFGWTWGLCRALLAIVILVPLACIDWEHWVLPFELTVPGIILGLLTAAVAGGDALAASLMGAVGGFLLFRCLEFGAWLLFGKEALGAGDKYLVAVIGAFGGVSILIPLTFLASLQGAAVGLVVLAARGVNEPAASGASGDTSAPPFLSMPRITWEFLRRGYTPLGRCVATAYSLLAQPIPDEVADDEGDDMEWQPGPTSIPFGPFLTLAAIEVMLLGPWMAHQLGRVGLSSLRWMF